jgi:nicotinamide phosphoribosyltransferase
MNPFLATDGYKTAHHKMYPRGTSLVYSNFTPRNLKHAPTGVTQVVSFGQQMVMKQIKEMFDKDFFAQPEIENLITSLKISKEDANNMVKYRVCNEIKKEYSMYLGTDYDVSHIESLWDLGYLPIKVKALPEGTLVPIGVPVLTIYNTKSEFYWLTNFLETLISNLLWKPITSATIAHQYKKNLSKWALKTDEKSIGFVEFQGHDFSMRGLDSIEATISSGLGHATSFMGSDSLPVIHGARKFYGEKDFVVGSVNATEHSVMCAGSKDDEIETFRYLMKQFPTGILSIVSDTWDLWKVLTEYLPILKDEILKRDGKIVIRPDSGNPVDIICGKGHGSLLDFGTYQGYRNYAPKDTRVNSESEWKGVIELLWDIFGGTVNEQGYKVLDPHIGAIYGDAITLDRAEQICERLEAKGFATTNIVLGIGSFTYQYNTRDTFGFAMKATYVELLKPFYASPDSDVPDVKTLVGREIFKDPITDGGGKKSAKGLLSVLKTDDEYVLHDQVDWDMENIGYLETIFEDGEFKNEITLTEIRNRLSTLTNKSMT